MEAARAVLEDAQPTVMSVQEEEFAQPVPEDFSKILTTLARHASPTA